MYFGGQATILSVSVRSLIESVPSNSFVVIYRLFVAAAPLPFVLATLDTVRASATIVVVAAAAVALAAAAEVALPLLPIVLLLLLQLSPPLSQLPSLILQTVLLLPQLLL